jgi:hypothetical protein
VELPTVPHLPKKAQPFQTSDRTHNRTTAHANKISERIEARVALSCATVEMIN